ARGTLPAARPFIVDEIHAPARDKRGSHLALSLARLDHVVAAAGTSRPTRIGLSATQRPVDEIAAFLVGASRQPKSKESDAPGFSPGYTAAGERASDPTVALPCTIVDLGHQRDIDLHIE